MQRFVIINSGYPMEVHAYGCADLRRKRLPVDWIISGENVEQALAPEVADLNHDFDHPYKQSELFRIMPCCKGGK